MFIQLCFHSLISLSYFTDLALVFCHGVKQNVRFTPTTTQNSKLCRRKNGHNFWDNKFLFVLDILSNWLSVWLTDWLTNSTLSFNFIKKYLLLSSFNNRTWFCEWNLETFLLICETNTSSWFTRFIVIFTLDPTSTLLFRLSTMMKIKFKNYQIQKSDVSITSLKMIDGNTKCHFLASSNLLTTKRKIRMKWMKNC